MYESPFDQPGYAKKKRKAKAHKKKRAKRSSRTGKWQVVYRAWNAKGSHGPEHGFGDYAEHAYFLVGYYSASSRREAMKKAKKDNPQARFGGKMADWWLFEPNEDQFKQFDGSYKDWVQGAWRKP